MRTISRTISRLRADHIDGHLGMTSSSTFKASDDDGYELVMGRWSRRLAEPFLDFAGCADGEQVLDVGCETGSLTFVLATRSKVKSICGLDFSPEYISYASHRNSDPRIEFKAGDACALPFPDRSFDRVLSLLMLHFVPRDGRQLRLIDLDQRVEAIAGPIGVWRTISRLQKPLPDFSTMASQRATWRSDSLTRIGGQD
jgi:SAM-dependent methyltransferase